MRLLPDRRTALHALSTGHRQPVALKLPLEQLGTPRAVAQQVRGDGPYWLLESGGGHPVSSRYSYLAWSPDEVVRGDTGETPSCLARLQRRLRQWPVRPQPLLPPFTGGAIGYMSYEARRDFEHVSQRVAPDLRLPHYAFALCDTVVAFDHVAQQGYLISHARPTGDASRAWARAVNRVEALAEQLQSRAQDSAPRVETHHASPLRHASVDRDRFRWMVKRALEYIRAGEIYQANLSLRLEADTRDDPWRVYERLQQINPSPYACYADVGDAAIVSCSPELLLRLRGDELITRPIAGTRPRGLTPEDNLALSMELILSEKERAEHLMLVDLERNDLGRVCRYGSVRIDDLMTLEEYSHVMHIVSQVRGRLRPSRDWTDVVAAVFPGGTITGCPKIRAMEIIDELEPVARGIYTGSMGWIGYNGDMELNIAIRTMLITGGRAYVSAGAGIVADSQADHEYAEVRAKAQALAEALQAVAPAPVGLAHEPVLQSV